MGFGKAQKRARNLSKKKAKITAEQEMELALINSLDDNRVYESDWINMTGKQWKEFYNISTLHNG